MAAGRVLDRWEQQLVRFSRPIALVGVLGMLVIAGVTLFDVLARWVANSPIAALNEVVSMVFAAAVAACIPSSVASDGQLRVDLCRHFFSPRQRALLDVLGAVLLLFFLILLTWRIYLHAGKLASEGRYTLMLGWPEAPFIFAVAGFLGLAAAIQAVVTANRAVAAAAANGGEGSARYGVTVVLILFAGLVALIGAMLLVDFGGVARWARDYPSLSVIAAFGLIWVFLLGLAPLGAVLGLLGLLGSIMFLDFEPAASAFATEPVGFITNSLIAVLPLFLMMGSFASVAGMAEDVYRLAHVILGRFRGGLALATIAGCAGFGCVTGSSIATAATIGRAALPEMRQRRYSPELSTGSVAAGGTLGQLIPPSGAIVIYALLTETSIGQLFIAALVPAALAVIFYLAAVFIFVRVFPGAAPAAATEPIAKGELRDAARGIGPVLIIFGAVLGGLYLGVFTATESAAVGAFGAFLCALFRGKLKSGAFWTVMEETVQTTAMIYMLIFGAITFAFFVSVTAMPEAVVAFVAQLDLRPILMIAILLVMYLALGCIMDSFAIMVITLPAVGPMIVGLGYDLIWWGIVMVVVVETGLITPPFGLNIFVIKSISGDTPLPAIFRGTIPFVVADFVKLALIVLVPTIVLWLPSKMIN